MFDLVRVLVNVHWSIATREFPLPGFVSGLPLTITPCHRRAKSRLFVAPSGVVKEAKIASLGPAIRTRRVKICRARRAPTVAACSMDYSLAKELKDAGFPQDGKNYE